MKQTKALLAIFLAAVMCLCSVSCSRTEEAPNPGDMGSADAVLNIGCGKLSGYFNPFYVSEGDDLAVCSAVGADLFELERGGNVVFDGSAIDYQGKEYTYDGIASCEVTNDPDGSVIYDIKIRDGVYFSDGEQLTADDVIFTLYVLADPAYDGPHSIASLPIKGINDYRAGMFVLSRMIREAGEDNTDYSYWTKEKQDLYWQTLKGEAGEKFAHEIVDYCINNNLAANVASAMKSWGYGDYVRSGNTYTVADFFNVMCEDAEYDYASFAYSKAAGKSLFEITDEILTEKDPTYSTAVMVSESEPSIYGIEKTGELSLRVITERYDAGTAYALAVNVAPLHYYGDEKLYDYDVDKFGFNKGDLNALKKIGEPLGAGPYVFKGFDGEGVSLAANDKYYLGAPATTKVEFVMCDSHETMVEGVANGSIDICSPELSDEIVTAINGLNGNGELNGDKIGYTSVDFNGYGFIGINASKMCVNGEPDSTASKNLRRAFAILFAAYREEAVEQYYGELAEVIEYPMSSASWAAPIPGDAGYAQAYAYDHNGVAIYRDGMTREERYDAALTAAVNSLAAAGFKWSYYEDRFYDAPYGARLSYNIIVPGMGKGDHPCYLIAEKVKEALGSVGIELIINDPESTNRLWTALNSGTQDMWCAAWTGSADPDLYKVYHSQNYPTNTVGTGKNHFFIADSLLDSGITEARSTSDVYYRKRVYFNCLNIILNWCVEVPVYQRQQAYIFSAERLDASSLPDEMTTYCNFMDLLHLIKVNK